MNSVLIFTSNIFHLLSHTHWTHLSHTHSTHTELSELRSTHRAPRERSTHRAKKLQAPTHSFLSSIRTRRTSLTRTWHTVSFLFPFLTPIHSFLWPITLISSIHPLITSFLTPIHSFSSFLNPIHTASTYTALIHTLKIQRMTVMTHLQTHKRPNLHPSLTPFWNLTFHRRQPNPMPFSPYLASLLLLLLLLLLYILFFWAMTVDCGIFIWLIMSIGCSWFVEWVAKIWCGYRGFGYKFDVKIVVVVRVG